MIFMGEESTWVMIHVLVGRYMIHDTCIDRQIHDTCIGGQRTSDVGADFHLL